jgi:hypothetical protein
MAIRDASPRIASISRILDGREESLGMLEVDYLDTGYLNELLSQEK